MALPKNKRTKKPARVTSGWQIQTAKAHLSEVIRHAHEHGPQVITNRGREDVVVLPIEQYRTLAERAKQPKSLVQFFAQSPLAEPGFVWERTPDYGRAVDL
jgi:prevent-host-death family protein